MRFFISISLLPSLSGFPFLPALLFGMRKEEKMVRVRATEKFERIIDGAIGRPRRKGEEWEVDEARAEHLVKHGVAELVNIVEPEEPQVEKIEKPKRGRKKKS